MKYAGIARRCIRTTAAVLLAAAAAAPAAAADLVPRAPISAVTVVGLDSNIPITLCDLVARVGPPMRDIGSGLFILVWDIDDGRVLMVGVSSLDGNQLVRPHFEVGSWRGLAPAPSKPASQ